MITRGYFIGEIIDELANIANQVDNRCRLGLTDLNKYLEDFFKEILNILFDLRLENLNDQRSNSPGLDLGDSLKEMAFQVTSEKTSAKINDTLNKISEQNLNEYKEFYVLIIGSKQRSYTIEDQLCKKTKFKEENILDINTLCKKSIELPLDILQSLYQYIKSEVVRVKIELEIPNKEGEFSTSIRDYVELIPNPTFNVNRLELYYSFQLQLEGEENYDCSIEELKNHFDFLTKELAKLPRITREFYAFLLERRDKDVSDECRFNEDRLRRICRYSDIDGEIRLLKEHKFLYHQPPAPIYEENYTTWTNSYFLFNIPGGREFFMEEFVYFIESNSIGYQKPIVHLNFSDF